MSSTLSTNNRFKDIPEGSAPGHTGGYQVYDTAPNRTDDEQAAYVTRIDAEIKASNRNADAWYLKKYGVTEEQWFRDHDPSNWNGTVYTEDVLKGIESVAGFVGNSVGSVVKGAGKGLTEGAGLPDFTLIMYGALALGGFILYKDLTKYNQPII